MREYMNLFEEDTIRKRNIDKRDMEEKLLDIINHPNTEQFLRDVAQRKLDKLRKEREAEEAKARADRFLPTIDVMLNIKKGHDTFTPLSPDAWDDVFVSGNGKNVTYRQIIEAVMPLGPFRIDFDPTPWQWLTAYSAKLWFHPEDEPENGQAISKAVKHLWAAAPDGDGHYLRNGTAQYSVFFDRKRFDPKPKRRY